MPLQTSMVSQPDDKLITSRVYKDGTAPPEPEKMNILRQDIEKLRYFKNEKLDQPDSSIKASKSLTNLVSFDKGIIGNSSIP